CSARAGVFPRRSGGWSRWAGVRSRNTVGVMDDTLVHPAPEHRPRLSLPAVAAVVIGGVLFCSWFWISLMLLATGLGALPVLGTGLLLLVPWLLAMQAAVRIERRRAVAVHGISVIVPARRRSRRTGFPGWLHDLWLEVSSAALWPRGARHAGWCPARRRICPSRAPSWPSVGRGRPTRPRRTGCGSSGACTRGCSRAWWVWRGPWAWPGTQSTATPAVPAPWWARHI